MVIAYSVIPGDAIIFVIGEHLEGAGRTSFDAIKWHLLNCTDCVWIVPGTEV